jgi:riboflavin kinase / FMN adenylyltransferase
MITHHNLTLTTPIRSSVITMGSFDGVHIGHRKILERVVETAQRMGVESVLITFDQHPRTVLNKATHPLKLLTTPSERRAIFEAIGINHLICLSFNKELAAMEPEEFIHRVFVNHLNAVKVITGFGHRFGKGGRGDHTLLEQESAAHGFSTEMIPMQDIQDNMISSTLIRQYLELGDIEKVIQFLGYKYQITGTVIKGSQIGKQIGFPTANIHPDHPEKLIPADGVYAVRASIHDTWHEGMMNIGLRPTVDGTHKTIEVHLFDFDREVYGDTITITFEKRLRDEQKFNSLEELKNQLTIDQKNAKYFFSAHSKPDDFLIRR